jgi:hypothetical protein
MYPDRVFIPEGKVHIFLKTWQMEDMNVHKLWVLDNAYQEANPAAHLYLGRQGSLNVLKVLQILAK